MKPKGIVIKSIIAILMLLCACSNGKTDTEEMSLPTFGTQNAINQEEGCDLEMFAPQIDKAISLNGTEGFQQTDIINVEPYYTTSGKQYSGTDSTSGLSWGISQCIFNGKNYYLLKEYSEPMAQFCQRYEILEVDPKTKAHSIIVEKPDVYWLNEFFACGKYLYWVEYHNQIEGAEGENYPVYRIVQYDLETKREKLLGERDGRRYDEICLAVDENYVTWYDSLWDEKTKEGTHSLIIYNVKNQEFADTPESIKVQKYAAFERLPVYDQGITFFSENEEGDLIVRRMELDTGKLTDLMIGVGPNGRKAVSCFSTKKYIGWLTEYGTGTYYIYLIQSAKLYAINAQDVFSKYCTGDKLYVCDSDKKYMECYDFSNTSVLTYGLGEYTGFRFYEGTADTLFLEMRSLNEQAIGITGIKR